MREKEEHLNCCSCFWECVATLKTLLTQAGSCLAALAATLHREEKKQHEHHILRTYIFSDWQLNEFFNSAIIVKWYFNGQKYF